MMLNLFRLHWPAMVLAVLVGFLLVLPPLWAKFRFGVGFSHPANIRIADEFFYFARIREVVDGYPTIGNAYLWEHKDKPSSPLFLGEWLLAQPVRYFGGEVVAWDVLFDFFLPALSVLLTYACVLSAASGQRWLALLTTAAFFWGFFAGDFARAVNPQIVFPFWLILFLLLWPLIRDPAHPRRRLFIPAAAGAFGLLFYLYPYYWTFYLILLGVAVLLFFFQGERALARILAAVIAGGLLIAVPYFTMMYRAALLPEYGETLRRISMIDSHFPSGIAIVVPAGIILLTAALLLWRRILILDRPTTWLLSGVAASALSVNQHVITGKNFEFSSHYYMLALFWFAFVSAAFLALIASRLSSFRLASAGVRLAVAIIAAVLIVPNFLGLTAWFQPPSAERMARDRYLPLFNWLNQHTEKDDVIYAPPGLSQLIPIYTGANVFFAAPVRSFFLSDEEVRDRFILAHAMTPLDRELVVRNFRSIFGNRYLNSALHTAQENKVRRLFGLAPKPVVMVPPEAIEKVLLRAGGITGRALETNLKRYRLDFAIWDRVQEPAAGFDALPFFKKIKDIGDLRVYQVVFGNGA